MASELQSDPAHQGLLILTATLRNRARYAIEYPHLALSLTGVQEGSGKVPTVARRVLAPTDYAGGTIDLAAGMPAEPGDAGQGVHRRKFHHAGGISAVRVLSLNLSARSFAAA